MKKHALILGLLGVLGATGASAATLLSENFDGIGAGTTPPTGWSLLSVAGTNTTWGAGGIALTGVTTSTTTGLTTNDAPTSNNNNGYNALGASGLTGDRCIATAPTGNAGLVIESLSVANTLGGSITSFNISYDENPGYWLFYTLDAGTTWNNVSSLNPTLTNVPNTAGTTNISGTSITLSSAWLAGSSMRLRWVDDNGLASSPDQILGLDNVVLTAAAVPEPASWSMLAVGALALVARRRRI